MITAFGQGIVPRQTSQALKRALEREPDPLKALALLRQHLPNSLIDAPRNAQRAERAPIEVILSSFLNGGAAQ